MLDATKHNLGSCFRTLAVVMLVSCFSIYAQAQGVHKIPKLADSFSVVIQANFVELNQSMELREFYDTPNNRLRIENHRRNHSALQIFLYDQDLHLEVSGGVCRTWNVTENRRGSFALDRDTHHLRSASDFYRESSDYNYTYQGLVSVRGIISELYHTTINTQFNSTRTGHRYNFVYDTKWMFASELWSFRSDPKHAVPTRLEIQGYRENLGTGEKFFFHHFYDWVSYEPQSPSDWLFEIPHWTFCPMLNQIPLPKFPDSFSMTLEANLGQSQTSVEIQEFVDFEGERLSIWSHSKDSHMFRIWNYKTETYNEIDVRNFNCTTLNATVHHGRFGSNGHIRRPSELFRTTASFNYTYGGRRRARGIECDMWRSDLQIGNGQDYYLEYYFSIDAWSIRGASKAHRVPVRVVFNGTHWDMVNGQKNYTSKAHHVYEFIDFNPVTPPDWAFTVPEELFCPALKQIPFPGIPDTFQAQIEFNNHIDNFTVVEKEYRDYDRNKLRFDSDWKDFTLTQIYDVTNDVRYSIKDSVCTVESMSKLQPPFNYNNATHHLLRERHWWVNTTVYGGHTHIRGILCHRWRFTREGAVANYTADIYFADEDWSGLVNSSQYIVAVHLNGTELINGALRKIQTTSSYTGVRYQVLDASVFDIPAVCNGATPNLDCSLTSGQFCTGLNRQPCGSGINPQPNTCGPCRTGYTTPNGNNGANTACTPVAESKALPVLDDEFSATIQANFLERDETLEIREYYDVKNNRVRLENHRRNVSRIQIYLYDQELHADITAAGCRTYNTTLNPRREFGYDPNERHLRRARDLYKDSSKYGYKYQGLSNVRGITSDFWSATISESFTSPRSGHTYHFNYTSSWYFAEEEWTFRGERKTGRIPTRTEINGTTFVYDSNMSLLGSHPIHHYYEWISFEPGTPGSWHFHLPHWTFCPALVNKPLPSLPNTFSTRIEANIAEKNYSLEINEIYDMANNRVRIDHHRHDEYIVQMWDYSSETHWTIRPNRSSCQTRNATQSRNVMNAFSTQTHSLRRTADLFAATASLNYTYGGVAHARGILCDRYRTPLISHMRGDEGVEYHLDWFFTHSSWRRRGESDAFRAPIRLVMNGTEFTMVNGVKQYNKTFSHHYEFIDFHQSIPPAQFFRPPRWIFCPALVQKPFPSEISDNWQASIEVNIPDDNLSFELREYHDWNLNKVRLETFQNDTVEVEIYDVSNTKHYSITGSNPGDLESCKVQILGTGMRDKFIAWNRSSHHLLHQRFENAKAAVYGGQFEIRGILCDRWRYPETYSEPGAFSAEFTTDWYFAVAEWKTYGLKSTRQYPVLAVINGTVLEVQTSRTKQFYRENVYTGIRLGSTDPKLYEVPAVCEGKVPGVDCSLLSKAECANQNRQPCGTGVGKDNECGTCLIGFKPNPSNPWFCDSVFTTPREENPETEGVSTGGAVGLSLGMVVIGIIIGWFAHFIMVNRRRGFVPFKSNNQDLHSDEQASGRQETQQQHTGEVELGDVDSSSDLAAL